ncbi:hypothetical protein VIGAN_05242500, partial [Vigna angularis var. angularis]
MENFADFGDGSKLVDALNRRLTPKQRSFIQRTPFGWFLELHENVKISRSLLNELCVRWVDSRGEFCFGEKIVEFKELSLVGEKIDLNGVEVLSECRNYFGVGNVDVNVIYEFLLQ